MKELLKGTSSVSSQTPGPQLVVCESQVDDQVIPEVGAQRIMVGPNSNTVYGWFNSDAAISTLGPRYFSGAMSINEFGFPAMSGGDLRQHSIEVISNLMDSKGQPENIIPIGANYCLDEPVNWISTVKRSSAARVVSLSAGNIISKETCENSASAKGIDSAKDQLLWVVAAGNEGKNGDLSDLKSCPVTLKQRPNMIVVGYGTKSALDQFSNFGVESVDLIADGASVANASDSASSFSTPRVAAVAAEIANSFPNLSISQIRLALLLAVDVNVRNPLAVRTGGFLNAAQALSLAAIWSQNSELTPAEVLSKWDSSRNGSKRIQFFKSRNLI